MQLKVLQTYAENCNLCVCRADRNRAGTAVRIRTYLLRLLLQIIKISVVDPDPDPEGKITHKKLKNLIFLNALCSFSRAEGFSCSSDVL
jgi:hypothetical protein